MRSNRQTGRPYSLDERDLALISRLQLDGRCSLAKMAQDLGIHRTTVKARLSRLLENNVIAPVIHVDPLLLGYHALATIGMKVAPGQLNAVLNEVAILPNIRWAHMCQGTYDVVLSGAQFRDEHALYSVVTDHIGNLPGIVAMDVMKSLDLLAFALPPANRARLKGPEETAHVWIRRDHTEAQLDENERAIISQLQNDFRQSTSSLASALGMSRNTVATSLRSLLDRGVVRTVMIPDPIALDYHIGVVSGISVLPGQLNTVIEGLACLDCLQYLVTCVGRYNLLAWSQYRDLDSWHRSLMAGFADIRGIREISNSVILRAVRGPYQFRDYGDVRE